MTDHPKIELSARLLAAAEYVREGARLADVGTDHAYLPVYLALHGRIAAALASDIAKGPLEKAREHIGKFHLENRIDTMLFPGLSGAEAFAPTDIVIAGMGGELIASIIGEAPFVKDSAVRLILQPMTKAEVLRSYLSENGFRFVDETLVREEDRFYSVIVCSYTGHPCTLTTPQMYFGPVILEKGGKELLFCLERKKEQYTKIVEGKKQGRIRDKTAEELLAYTTKRIEELYHDAE